VPAESAARSLFGRDPTLEIVLRAATSPASVTNSGWAGALAAQVVDDFVASIAVLSAGAALIGRGMRLDFAGYASIRIPGRIFDLDNAGN
jgi:hypothetical protein